MRSVRFVNFHGSNDLPCVVSFDQSFRLNALILKMEYSCPREESPGIESRRTGVARDFDSDERALLETTLHHCSPAQSRTIDVTKGNRSFDRATRISRAGLRLVAARDSDVG